MNILVTGGTGFIGSHIAKHYQESGHHVMVTGKSQENNTDCVCLSTHFGFEWEDLPKIDVLIHQAAITDTLEHNREMMLDVNFWQSRRLFDRAIAHGVTKIVYASSAAVYGDNTPPFVEESAKKCLNVYAESKLLLDRYSEILANSNPNLSIVGLRYSNVYGPGEEHKKQARSMILQLYQQMKVGNPRLFEWGEQRRDFVYIEDVVAANVAAVNFTLSGIFNVGSGMATSFNQVVTVLNELLGTQREIEYFKSDITTFYQNHTELDLSRSIGTLGYKPRYTAKEGIKKYLDYLK
jgi:ADP-L-glycero-D-manno-heptose 6-epimerase